MQKAANILIDGVTGGELEKKYFKKFKEPLVKIPNLVDHQVKSYQWLLKDGFMDIFKEFSPIKDYADKKFELSFTDFEIVNPKYDEYYAKDKKISFECQLKGKVKLKNKTLGTVKEQEIFLSDVPLMTGHGTFIIN